MLSMLIGPSTVSRAVIVWSVSSSCISTTFSNVGSSGTTLGFCSTKLNIPCFFSGMSFPSSYMCGDPMLGKTAGDGVKFPWHDDSIKESARIKLRFSRPAAVSAQNNEYSSTSLVGFSKVVFKMATDFAILHRIACDDFYRPSAGLGRIAHSYANREFSIGNF